MNYYALFPTVTSLLFLFMGLFIFHKNKQQLINRVYLYFCISIFIWLFPFSLMYWSKDAGNAYLFARIGFVGVLLIPICTFYFVVVFLDKLKYYKNVLKFLTCLSLPCAVVNFFTPVFYSGIKVCFWGYYPIAGKLYFLILSEFLIIFCYAIFLLLKDIHNVKFSAIKQQQTKYLLGAFFMMSFGCVDYITKYPLEIYPFGYILILLFIVIMAISIIKYNLMDIKIALTRTSIIFLVYLFVLGVPLYIGFFFNEWAVAFFLVFVFSSVAPVIFRSLQKKAEILIMAEQEKYQQFLIQASKGMIEQHDVKKLSKLIVRIMKQSVKIKFVSLYIFDEEKNYFYNMASRTSGHKKINNLYIDKENPIVKYMKMIKRPFLYLGLKDDLKKEFSKICSDINLIVPSIFRDEVLGFLILGEKENKTLYSQKDKDLFRTLSNQASLAIENCFFLDKSKRQQEKLFEAEKLASIGGMADGMAHQIRNRLNSFSLAADSLRLDLEDLTEDNKDFVSCNPSVNNILTDMNDLISSIKNNIKKTDTILTGILNFAKHKQNEAVFEYFSLKDVLESSILLVEVKHHKEKLPIKVNVSQKDMIYGIKYQLQEVFFNFIDNAFEAIVEKQQHLKNAFFNDIKSEQNFIPEIKASLKYLSDNKCQIIIEDNGIGVKEENKPKIFSAFFTTKPSSKSGSGIGSYVAKRMVVEAHKGSITFESKYGKGTTFFITIPMFQKQSKQPANTENSLNSSFGVSAGVAGVSAPETYGTAGVRLLN